ncbi:aspartic proteinase cdr1 [Phtheirospermum japonicum]|uniref:Aspartic proteinase cdr1 n=1 Tax=Phtheirospermum japonicum TaxID=374723 RepID=A0A830C613_9LAMI|nr:aspartic proteinase cdr1 [Phtheirospermum japonicum]
MPTVRWTLLQTKRPNLQPFHLNYIFKHFLQIHPMLSAQLHHRCRLLPQHHVHLRFAIRRFVLHHRFLQQRQTHRNTNRRVPGFPIWLRPEQRRTVWPNRRITRPQQRPNIILVPNCKKVWQIFLLLPPFTYKRDRVSGIREK